MEQERPYSGPTRQDLEKYESFRQHISAMEERARLMDEKAEKIDADDHLLQQQWNMLNATSNVAL
jgi:hypothetical protein